MAHSPHVLTRAAFLMCALAGGLALRLAISSQLGDGSPLGGIVFACVLLGAAVLAGSSRVSVGAGAFAVVLVTDRAARGEAGGAPPGGSSSPVVQPMRLLPAAALGLFGAAVLVAVPIWLRLSGPGLPLPPAAFPVWASVVTAVAVAEELVLRGALFTLLARALGQLAALSITSLAFAALHVPLYGWDAFPLDLAAGVWLGGLRLASGSAAAPALAHALADLAGWWLM